MKLLRVDMKQLQVRSEAVPAVYEHVGGRGLIAELLVQEVPPRCDALGPHNKLIFAPGLLGGAGVTTAVGTTVLGAAVGLAAGTTVPAAAAADLGMFPHAVGADL